jgi:hypothetical protein
MPKKARSLAVRETVHVLQPAQSAPNMRDAIERLVEQKISEIMGEKSDGIFAPFFQTQAIASAIRRQETVAQQNKWIFYFADWGCMVCGKTDRKHVSLGMCVNCYAKTRQRLAASLRRAELDKPSSPPVARDLTDLARASLRRRR